MSRFSKIMSFLVVARKLVRYNLKIIFANKFIYFLLAAVTFFIGVTLITLFSNDIPAESTVYGLLLFHSKTASVN